MRIICVNLKAWGKALGKPILSLQTTPEPPAAKKIKKSTKPKSTPVKKSTQTQRKSTRVATKK